MSLDETLEELERLERQATPGPWKDEIDAIGYDPGREPWHVIVVGTEERGRPYMESTDLVLSDADRWLIVTARNALPSLLAEVRRLRSELEAALGALREIVASRSDAIGLKALARAGLASVGGGDAGKGEGR